MKFNYRRLYVRLCQKFAIWAFLQGQVVKSAGKRVCCRELTLSFSARARKFIGVDGDGLLRLKRKSIGNQVAGYFAGGKVQRRQDLRAFFFIPFAELSIG